MPILSSIQTADRLFATRGSRPFLITCSDMNDYVCKYNIGSGRALRLMCEYIGTSYLKLWGIKAPDFGLISVNKDHIPKEYNINSYSFDATCFGSKYSRNYVDVIDFTAVQQQSRKAFPNREEILYIALFDIWIANEDRNSNNYNLLIDVDDDRRFIPIDHEAILNTRVLDRTLCELTYDDSIISSPLFLKLFNKNDFEKPLISELRLKYFDVVNHCQKMTQSILSELPSDWKIDIKQLKAKLINELFVNNWTEKSFNLFLEFLQRNINIK